MPLPVKMPESPLAEDRELLHLSSREVPPGGMSFKIAALSERSPLNAWVGPYNSIYDLVNEVHRRERANGLDLTPESVVEDQVCQRCPPGYCRDASNRSVGSYSSGALSLGDVIAGTLALLRWFLHGSVPEARIVARTQVCNACPENRLIGGCQGCAASALYKIINRIVVRGLPSDAVLGACGACKCSLKAKVRMQLEDVQHSLRPESRERLWGNCWILREEAGETLRSDPRT